MSLNGAHNLSPCPSSFTLDGETYVLKPFTLNAQIWAGKRFATKKDIDEGLDQLSRVLKREIGDYEDFRKTIVILIYYLLDHDSKKKISEKKLNKKINQNSISTIVTALSECIGNSQPQLDEAETRRENKEMKKKIELMEKRIKELTGSKSTLASIKP